MDKPSDKAEGMYADIAVHPLRPREFPNEIRKELKQYGIGIQLSRSEFRQCHLEAVSQSRPWPNDAAKSFHDDHTVDFEAGQS